ncbi:tryptophan synthase subunit alpha [Porcincola intestinalis]|uniref:Tryptophan synthase alpha chain n=1 Tax=Porcincola intestinalis TaxID=2606632 RepID=A0A6L5X4Y4_9FIRM|nr:tryptophan synthase subunit alpha [Porcincola intestinalis]MCI6766498.1 tryptophan synthase subunit alpha [Lachnospiraceae bacterium]MDD7060779.1 tryptophan synthase subunit alpha [Porcincola intestinalis]MDY5283209.1 tryptophan synthase subunit alpha [Porcincola intestinalis]MDY5578603.1 tryptophan synthase subunit alpha [Porcincola intestinalis]MSS14685.1 tryptophan synthase subunit alpha [Porcincola intestinalis]
MSKKIANAFRNGKAFIPFITAGDPDLASTERFVLAMAEAGADLIEIGIPFSDPIAEGVVIQEADIRALRSGTTTEKVFEMVKSLRQKTDIPLVFMTYLNIVFYYGYDRFFTRCAEVGISGIIIPDLPYEEKNECAGIAAEHQVEIVSMIAPTSRERIQTIASDAEGFLYVVSSMGVTGVRQKITTDLKTIIGQIREVTSLPAAIGFGISTPGQASDMAAISDGAIVGSAIVRLVAEYGREAEDPVREYVRQMAGAVHAL